MGYDGLLLDHDGVIVTLGDRDALRTAARTALEAVGVAAPATRVVDTLSVAVDYDELVAVSEQFGLDPARLWHHRDEQVAASLRAEATAGRKAPYDDLDHVDGLGIPAGIVSNNQTRVIEFVLDHYGLRDRFDTVRAREPTPASLRRKKPEPTYLAAAMADLGVESPLYVGDSESDVVAGKRQGLDVAFLRRPHNEGRPLSVEPTYDVGGLDAVAELLASA